MSPNRLIISAVVVGIIVITVLVVGFLATAPQRAPEPVESQAVQTPAPPPPPSVSFTVVKSKIPGHNQFVVSWQNLPNGSVLLNVYRKTQTALDWSLWKTVTLAPGELANGSFTFSIGNQTFGGYSFYAQATGQNGETTGTNASGTTPTVLWESSSTIPTVTTSTPSTTGGTPTTPTSTATSTSPTTNPTSTTPTPSSTSSSTPSSGTPSTTQSGIPYYNPQVQLSGYGNPPSGNFWAQYVNGGIELGWQGLPSNVTNIIITRSNAQTGPWAVLMTQGNPAPSSTYTIQVVDQNVNQPTYYEMTAYQGSSTVATYGPVYLN